jgi:spermidine synthase
VRQRRLAIVLLLFFFSGACGLTYQVLWLRLLSLVFGVTVYAASTVLAAFMSGLALGSVLAAPLLRKVRRPLTIFGLAEILIGASALATPLGLRAAEGLYRALYSAAPESLTLLTFARFICALLVLLVPTILMGLTLPVLSASSLVRESRVGARISALYAINTAGAVVGAVTTGFVLIGAIGIQCSFYLAAAVNALVGAVALLVSEDRDAELPRAAAIDLPTPRSSAIFAVVVAVSGVAALALEIVWFRMLVLYLDATTYAFTTMLATVLAGIASGGAVAARLLKRDRDWPAWLVVLQIGVGLAVIVSAIVLARNYGRTLTTELQTSVAAIFPAAFLMGLSFPIALRAALGVKAEARDAPATARRVGELYALNVAGAIAGALLGGFVALPQLGTRQALMAMASLYVAAACIVALGRPRRRGLIAAAALGVMVYGLAAARAPDPFDAAYERRYGRDMREFWRHDGVQTAVSVHASQFRRALYLDGLHQANDTPEMVRLHRVIGHLPMVLHGGPSDALVVGLGGGATAGAVSQYRGVRVKIVELSDGVRRAASFFSHISYDVLNQPNVSLRIGDGRNFLSVTNERFDVITADIIQPSHAGAGSLYSHEYFTLVRRALKDDGIALQWIGHRSAIQYRLIMRTFLSVFPDATLWFDGGLMVGSLSPLKIDREIVAAKRANPITAAALDAIGLHDFETLARWYTAGPDEMRRLVGAGPILTDDQPLVEYHRSLPADDPPIDLSNLRGDVARILR